MTRPPSRAAARLLALLEVPALAAVPLVLGVCAYFQVEQGALLTVVVAFAAVGVFFASFEASRPALRQIMPTVVLAALAAAGRMLFAPVPDFKPVSAICILAGAVFGRRSGFLVGALAALVSNFFFGQGPWTPWQMFAMGLCGFLAGVLYRRGLLRRGRVSLCIYGALSALLVYGVLMNVSSALLWQSPVSWATIGAYLLSGFPVDCVHAAATVCFLWLFGEPMLEKLDRIKVKYGLLA